MEKTQPSTTSDESKDAKQAAQPDADKAKADAQGDDGKAQEQAKPDPASYELKVPEGYKLDDAVSSELRQYAADRNLKQQDVDALLAIGVKMQQKNVEAYENIVDGWSKAVTEDKELGGANWEANRLHGNRAVSNLFDKDFIEEILVGYQLGTHPGFVRAMVKLGKQMGEGSIEGKAGSAGAARPKTLEERMYGTSGNAVPGGAS